MAFVRRVVPFSVLVSLAFAPARAVAQSLAGKPGSHEVLLVTLENGDVEDDLEATVTALRHAHVRTFVLAHEAFLSDSYATSHYAPAPPKGTTWSGEDGAFAEVP